MLTLAVSETVFAAEADARSPCSATLRRDGEAGQFTEALAAAWRSGASVDWQKFFAGTGAKQDNAPDICLPAHALLA